VRDKHGGIVVGDLLARTLEYRSDDHSPVVVSA
jgi:hypothetical protein